MDMDPLITYATLFTSDLCENLSYLIPSPFLPSPHHVRHPLLGSMASSQVRSLLPLPPRPPPHPSRRHYSLHVVQHPLRARMCGFGDKVGPSHHPLSPPSPSPSQGSSTARSCRRRQDGRPQRGQLDCRCRVRPPPIHLRLPTLIAAANSTPRFFSSP